jgi:hypothetical protein
MNAGSPDVFDVLRRARAGMSPTSGDAARVRAAVAAALTAPLPGASERSPLTDPSPAPRFAALAKLGLAAAFATATGATGYLLGFRAGVAERSAPPPVSVRATPTAAAPSDGTPATLRATAPDAATASALSNEVLTPPRLARASASSPLPPASGTGPSAESTLELETRLLGRVEHALRDGNPRLALGLLGELDRSVPGGQLGEERSAARVVAHCELGSSSAPELAAEFRASHPASAYLRRVEQACQGAPERGDGP